MPVTVGTSSLTFYNSIRNFIDLPYEDVQFKKVYNPLNLAVKPLKYLRNFHPSLKTAHKMCTHTHLDIVSNGVQLLHFWNVLNTGNVPWIATIESVMPRWVNLSQTGIPYAFKAISNQACRQIICISENSLRVQSALFAQYPLTGSGLEEKLCVVYPSQKRLIQNYDQKPLDSTIVFTIIGGHFFRKGGKEILDATSTLIEEGYSLKLKIISGMTYGDYASKTTRHDLEAAKATIAKYPQHVEYLGPMSNHDTLRELLRSHVCLLPTYDDSFGYSVLEAQASGCPVITTNVRALPEINNNRVGWLLDVPRDSLGYARFSSEDGRKQLSDSVRDQLYSTMKMILNDPASIQEKGIKALSKIESQHNPAKAALWHETLYREIVASKRPLRHRVTNA